MTDEDIALSAVCLAESIFGENLALAFVGGSRASGALTSRSDIDAFVVIETSDRESEGLFAKELRALHVSNGLHFDHYGEIFSRPSLNSLLYFTEELTSAFPAIRESPCYRGNCLLSIFRKGQVVLRFLQGAKLHIRDRCGWLRQLEKRSHNYFAAWDVEIPGPDESVNLPVESKQYRLAESWQNPRNRYSTDTPVGIVLERWFGENLASRLEGLDVRGGSRGPVVRGNCPLAQARSTPYAIQCLARK